MKIRLYFDEDSMATALIQALRTHDIDLLTLQEAQIRGLSDEDQLLFATEQGRVLYSFNKKNFMVLHTRFMEQSRAHPF